MAARANKIRHDDTTRAKIQAGVIIDRFTKCLNGDIELSPTQVSCGKALLNKVIPDIQSVSIDANVGMTVTIAKEAADL
jgi:hypothetical protein